MKTLTALIALATSLSSASISDCPWSLPRNENLRQFGTSCYQFYLTQKKYLGAAHVNCSVGEGHLGTGGHLVDIHSQSEQDFLIKSWQALRYQEPNEVGLWIGLWNPAKFGAWYWLSDNQGMDYYNWAPFQQNELDTECTLMEYSGTGKWHEYNCDDSFGWICEYKITNNSKT